MRNFIFISMLLSTAAFADQHFDHMGKLGLGGSIGYNTPVFGNSFNDAADGAESWSIYSRYHYSQKYGFEASYAKHEFDDVTQALQVFDLSFFRRLKPLAQLSPVLGVGFGGVDIPNNGDESTKLGLKARAGIEYAIAQTLSLGINLDYQNVDVGSIHALAGRVGLTYYWGSSAAAAPLVAAAMLDADTDKDWVVDTKDKCPGTPKGTVVNAYGCPKEKGE